MASVRGNEATADGPAPVGSDTNASGAGARHPEVTIGRDRATGKFVGRNGKSEADIKAELFGTEAPKEEAKAEPETKVEQPEAKAAEKTVASGGSEKGTDESAGVEAKALHKAIDWLKRDKTPEYLLSKMSDAEKIAYAKERKAIVIERQQAQQRIAELEKGSATISDKAKTGSVAGEPRDIPAGAKGESVKEFRDLYGDEAAAALEKALESAVGPLRTRLEGQISAYEQSNAARTAGLVAKTKEGLLGRYPQLEDDDDSSEWFETMKGLAKAFPDRYKTEEDFERLGIHAASNLDWTPVAASSQADKESDARARANGVASSGKSRAAPAASLNKEDRVKLGFKLAMDPKISVEEGRAKVRAQ